MWQMEERAFIDFAIGELVKIGLIDRESVLDSVRIPIRKAYPAYFGTYGEFGKVRAYLDAIPNLYCIGRNGQHRYNNMDHSMLTAFAAVEHILSGKDSDRSKIWTVNTEKEYHEERRRQTGHRYSV